MRDKCKLAVSKAIGRDITRAEAQGIEDRIRDNMRNLARTDPDWASKSLNDRLRAAAEAAGKQVIGEAALKVQRTQQAINALTRGRESLDKAAANGERMFVGLADDMRKSEVYIKGVQREAWTGMLDAINAAEPRFLGIMENAVAVRDFVREVFAPGTTGNQIAAKGAKAWTAQAELLRQRFNSAGGDIGKIDYGYLPQPHDSGKVRGNGSAEARQAWIDSVLPKLDQRRYLNEDGTQYSQSQLNDMLADVWTSISTNGANKIQPGGAAKGSSMLANRGNKSREIHFKDADSWIEYMGDYGRGQLFSSMQGHVHRVANDIGLLERYGPNPAQTYETLRQTAYQDAATKGQKTSDMVKVGGVFFASTDSMWHNLSGKANIVKPEYANFAAVNQGARNLAVAGMLGRAVFSALGDFNSYFLTTRFNKLPFTDSLINIVRAQGKDAKDFANKAGLIQEGFVADVQTLAADNVLHGWSGNIASATMKATLLTGLTDAVRRSFSMTYMGALGKLSRTDWAMLAADDRARLVKQGIDEADWKIVTQAKPEDWRGSQMLTPDSIRGIAGVDDADKNRVVAKVLGLITDESEYASIAPDLYARSIVTGKSEKGTVGGEFRRHLMLFKGTPIAMVTRHFERGLSQDALVDRATYMALLIGGGTAVGAAVLQLKDIQSGKDPRKMDDAKFWAAAATQGGGMGIAGDFLYQGLTGKNRAGNSMLGSLLGPTLGQLERGFDAAGFLIDGVSEKAKGMDVKGDDQIKNAGDQLYRMVRSMTPGVNIWYAQSVLDHAILMDLQEYLSPGYVNRMKQRAIKDNEQDYYWQPNQLTPDRAPDFERMFGS
ncbi:hypothetical protein DBR37_01570 [Herminiimonas sp. KBW02]|uniref:hypothetical protein n=1 Tax=Herminiimonas sp. KBW02 TaxID=2153363 RepID=UPI000F59FAF7|nr:hypothetical protein [Herminiimonas sp. KBW02]RQO38611.1 hypothetical protein DBR37_01570 [Herminiimonas sp. KBW02]